MRKTTCLNFVDKLEQSNIHNSLNKYINVTMSINHIISRKLNKTNKYRLVNAKEQTNKRANIMLLYHNYIIYEDYVE